jgi:folate-binding protein YgfZ
MAEAFALMLDDRAVLRLAGADLRDFLQGIVSNDVTKVSAERAQWSAFLTPQGKYLHDFFLAEVDDGFLLDCEAARAGDLLRRLKLYRLRSKVELAEAGAAIVVVALYGAEALDRLGLPPAAGAAKPFADGVAFVDPRRPELGARALLPRETAAEALAEAGFTEGAREAYDRRRISLGLPDGSRDMAVEKAILLECGFDELGGVDWKKGCFMGQELTARTKYRGLVKKRLLPVAIDGPTPQPGSAILRDGKEAGVLRSAVPGLGLALLRLEHIEGLAPGALSAGEAKLTPQPPAWLKI